MQDTYNTEETEPTENKKEPTGGWNSYIRETFQPYVQPIDIATLYSATAVFAVAYTAIFAYCDKSNVDYYGNIINFYNSIICFSAVLLYLATNNVWFAIMLFASFLSSSLVEIVMGYLFYPSRMFLSTYIHHIIYSIIALTTIHLSPLVSLLTLCGIIEVSAIFQSIKRMWNVRSREFDILNAAVFFVSRLVIWIPILYVFYVFSESSVEYGALAIVSLSIFLHIYWSWTQLSNILRKHFSGQAADSGNTTDEMYLTTVSEKVQPSVQPSSIEPSSIEPSSIEPSSIEPSSIEPSSIEPSSILFAD